MLHFVSAQRFEAEFSVDIFSESHNDYIFVDIGLQWNCLRMVPE